MTGEASASRTLQAIELLGSYELLRPLAQGGMADIYLGKGSDDRHVAIKVLNEERSKEPESCTMFIQEARLVALLDHPNIAQVLDVDVSPEGHHYLAMEYVHGADLRELLSAASHLGRAVPYDTAIAIVIGAAAGLDHAHRRCGPDGKPLRLVHRDVSLSNIMVSHAGDVKVVDFGIASTSIQTVHTSPGIVRGKASYMSPEQCMGDRVDHRTDVFALGVVLYELTTGARCFSGKSDFERMLAVVRGDYLRPHEIFSDFPAELEQVIGCALSIDATMRYASAAALIEALQRVLAGRNWSGGPDVIVREMHELFGDVPAPWKMTAAEGERTMNTERDLIAIAAAALPIIPPMPAPGISKADPAAGALPLARLTAPTMRAPRMARGTEADPPRRLARGSEPAINRSTMAGWAPGPAPIDDDQPTRGRCAMRRPPTAPGLDR